MAAATGASRNLTPLRERAKRHLWLPYSAPGTQGTARDEIVIVVEGNGCTIRDSDGHTYIDGISALEAMILGHGDLEVVAAMEAQARELAFLDLFRFAAPVQIELAAELADVSPGMQYVHFTPGGAEADEVAIKLARQYHELRGQPHRKKVITRAGAFHGVTGGAMALDGHYFASRNVLYDGGVNWGRTAPAIACPRCDFGKATRHLACPHTIEAVIEAEGPETVAAVVVDPAATAIAVACPPDSYLRELAEICRQYDVLLVVDEVITGMGRTGRLFCTEYSGVQPDFVTMSKGLSSGYAPIGAALVAPHVAAPFEASSEGIFFHGHTYAGHPVAAAAARTVLRRVLEERLWERAQRLGSRLLDGLRSLEGRRHYWDARGRGLLLGLEIVEDAGTGRDFADRVAAGHDLRRRCRELGLATLVLHPGNVLFVAPPLVIAEAEIDRIVAILDEALRHMEAER